MRLDDSAFLHSPAGVLLFEEMNGKPSHMIVCFFHFLLSTDEEGQLLCVPSARVQSRDDKAFEPTRWTVTYLMCCLFTTPTT